MNRKRISENKPTSFNKSWKSNGRPNGRQQNKRKKSSDIDPYKLIKKAEVKPEVATTTYRKFEDLDIDARLKERILKKGYTDTTEIQDKTIESVNAGRDVLAIASTGSGKTAAFLIPIINQLLRPNNTFQTLVLVPTRELAIQVEQEFRSLTKDLKLYSLCLIGGTSVNRDIERLKRNSHLVVGTPGRVADLMKRRVLNLQPFTALVLDEFDRMLDMGFVDEVMRITEVMRNRRQTLLFSATENRKQRSIIEELLNNQVEIRVTSGNTSAESVDQDIVHIKQGEDKYDVFLKMIKDEEFNKVLVFAETKRNVFKLAKKLKQSGIRVDEIHGDKSQNYREKALKSFRNGHVQILVATDVAARGIDVDDISHVINYQMPQTMDTYIHRIGRTGRAGKSGKAFTLVDHNAA